MNIIVIILIVLASIIVGAFLYGMFNFKNITSEQVVIENSEKLKEQMESLAEKKEIIIKKTEINTNLYIEPLKVEYPVKDFFDYWDLEIDSVLDGINESYMDSFEDENSWFSIEIDENDRLVVDFTASLGGYEEIIHWINNISNISEDNYLLFIKEVWDGEELRYIQWENYFGNCYLLIWVTGADGKLNTRLATESEKEEFDALMLDEMLIKKLSHQEIHIVKEKCFNEDDWQEEFKKIEY